MSGVVASPSPADGRKKVPAEIIPAGASARKPARYWLVWPGQSEFEPQGAYFARIFYGLDPDGYELMFEQHHAINRPT